jgi:HK97 family phage major capsid protein
LLATYRFGNSRDRTLYAPAEIFLGATRDLATAPASAGGALVGLITAGESPLRNWSACLKSGALMLTGLRENVTLWEISPLQTPQWLAEIGQITPSDPGFSGPQLKPVRISSETIVSRQLLVQQADDTLSRILVNDLSRQLGNFLDQSALFGAGSASNQPAGLVSTTGVQALTFTGPDYNTAFATAEEQIESVNIDMTSFAELVSPATKQKLRTTAAFSGGGASVWEKLTRPQSSPEIRDNTVFVGCFSMMTFCLWGRGVEILINPYTLADQNKVKIDATLLCNVGIRYPSAFGFGPLT